MDRERLLLAFRDTDIDNFGGSGVDSVVHLIRSPDGQIEAVAKFYGQGTWLSPEELNLYVQTTNTAAKIAESENWKCNFGLRIGTLTVRVVPFLEVQVIEGVSVGICPAVIKKSGTVFEKNSRFVTELNKLADKFNTRLGTTGIKFSPLNVQVDQKTRTLLITDLCDDILQLTRKS